MYARWETNTKYEVAKKMLSEMVDSLQGMQHLELALRVYGHTKNIHLKIVMTPFRSTLWKK
ncbi:MAG: hypothetical protein IPO63_11980 [Bacteroidetes bacterium]|nr:hypothetical protein [Bacteroidota bacterium]